jgi:AcrR family transcriptional regulator
MLISPRILRATANSLDRDPPSLTARQQAQQERILTLGQALFARYGYQSLNLANLALALSIGKATLRRHFVDLDALLAAILQRHLLQIAGALAAISPTAPDAAQQRRAAYIQATRAPFGGLNEAHLLLIRDRHLLPEDELTAIEETRATLGILLAGDAAEEAFTFLDAPSLQPAEIETLIAALITARTSPAPPPQPALPEPALHFSSSLPAPWARRLAEANPTHDPDHDDLGWLQGALNAEAANPQAHAPP